MADKRIKIFPVSPDGEGLGNEVYTLHVPFLPHVGSSMFIDLQQQDGYWEEVEFTVESVELHVGEPNNRGFEAEYWVGIKSKKPRNELEDLLFPDEMLFQ